MFCISMCATKVKIVSNNEEFNMTQNLTYFWLFKNLTKLRLLIKGCACVMSNTVYQIGVAFLCYNTVYTNDLSRDTMFLPLRVITPHRPTAEVDVHTLCLPLCAIHTLYTNSRSSHTLFLPPCGVSSLGLHMLISY